MELAGLTFDALTHQYALNGVPVPFSVTGILKAAGYIDFQAVPLAVLLAGRDRGRRVHTAIALALEDDLEWTTIEEDEAPYVRAALAAIDTLHLRATGIEQLVYHAAYGYAGCVDLIAQDDRGRAVVLDWKTGDPADVAADLQLAGYHLGLSTNGFPNSARRIGVQLDRDGDFHLSQYDNPADYTAFLAAVAHVSHLRQRGRI